MSKDICSSCGKDVYRGPDSRSQIVCHGCRRLRPKSHNGRPELNVSPSRIRTCEYVGCGRRFIARGDKPERKQRTCSRSCGQKIRNRITSEGQRKAAERERSQRKCSRRRALQRGGRVEPYTLAEIAARDHCRCGICRKKVDMRIVDGRRSLAPTIDHIVPISEGGDDIKTNVRLAHRRCNSSRGARGGGEQLRLVG